MTDQISFNDYKDPVTALEDAARLKQVAKENYKNAMKRAHEAGVSNTKIAKTVGISETAVRMYLQRYNFYKSPRSRNRLNSYE